MVSEADGLHRAMPVVDVRSKLCHDDNTNVAKLFFRGRYIGSASDHPDDPFLRSLRVLVGIHMTCCVEKNLLLPIKSRAEQPNNTPAASHLHRAP